MKIAVTSTGDTLDSIIDQRFGRADKFLVIDTNTGKNEVFNNSQNVNLSQGAGIQTAENVSRLGVEYVITGHCGPKAFHVLKAAGIKIIVGAEGTVRVAIQELVSGKLVPADNPDVEGHWM
ncbi:MAG: dinitrogenase iron-molybdenum cofactor biosynthesis protein [bacterium]|nr:dinitrogenase iron-molybdenum cofactor biosynthesis protein [bacterium]